MIARTRLSGHRLGAHIISTFPPERKREMYARAVATRNASPSYHEAMSRKMRGARNPMANPASREKMRSSIIRLIRQGVLVPYGGRPYGNGRSPTPAEARLLAAFPQMRHEFIVPTGMGRGSGYPTHYKIDIADPVRRIAIEIDGSSHSSPARRMADMRKSSFLTALGWKLIRLSSRQVLRDWQRTLSLLATCGITPDTSTISK
jgi:hypothetical protein